MACNATGSIKCDLVVVLVMKLTCKQAAQGTRVHAGHQDAAQLQAWCAEAPRALKPPNPTPPAYVTMHHAIYACTCRRARRWS